MPSQRLTSALASGALLRSSDESPPGVEKINSRKQLSFHVLPRATSMPAKFALLQALDRDGSESVHNTAVRVRQKCLRRVAFLQTISQKVEQYVLLRNGLDS
jgi:hypothetical protein